MQTVIQMYYWWLLHLRSDFVYHPSRHLFFKVDNRNTKTMCKICAKFTIMTPERHHWSRSYIFIVNFEQTSHIFLYFRWSLRARIVGWDEVVAKFPINHYRNFLVINEPNEVWKLVGILEKEYGNYVLFNRSI